MTYETCGHTAPETRSIGSGKLMPITALLVVVALIALGEVKAPSPSQSDTAETITEDWHGNVRRSHWNR